MEASSIGVDFLESDDEVNDSSDELSSYSSASEAGSFADEDEFDRMENMNERETKQYLDKLLSQFFFGCNISFVTVESSFFVKFIESVSKSKFGYKPPCAKTMAEVHLPKTLARLNKVKKRCLKNTDSVLLCDGWKNPNSNKHLMVFTLSTIHIHQAFLHAIDISTQREFGEDLAENINEAIQKANKKYRSNVYAVVTDNDSKMLCGVRKAVPGEGVDHDLWQSSCSSHSGNLLCTHFENKEDPQFFKFIRSLNVAFKHPRLHSMLITAGGKMLKVCPDTRWLYMKDSLERILENLPLLRDIAQDPDVILEQPLKTKLLDVNFEVECKNWLDILTPIAKFVKKCESTDYNVADSTEDWCQLRSKLPADTYDDIVEQRIAKAIWECGYAANYLHHSYQGKSLDRDQKKRAIEFINNNLNPEGLEEFQNFHFNDPKFSIYIKQCISPITFWNFLSPMVPNLSKIAIKLMLIPASTASIEGFFSQWKFVHSSTRNRLGFQRSCDLIDVYYSLRHGTKPIPKRKKE